MMFCKLLSIRAEVAASTVLELLKSICCELWSPVFASSCALNLWWDALSKFNFGLLYLTYFTASGHYSVFVLKWMQLTWQGLDLKWPVGSHVASSSTSQTYSWQLRPSVFNFRQVCLTFFMEFIVSILVASEDSILSVFLRSGHPPHTKRN